MSESSDGPVVNTDRELWREREGDYYSPSLHVTQGGGIGIDVGGYVFVKPIREWHALAGGKAAFAASPLPSGGVENCVDLSGTKQREPRSSTEIDEAGAESVNKQIEAVRAAGLEDEAHQFETLYWGWLRLTEAYVNGHPYVSKPEKGMTPLSALHVTDFTFRHWAPQIPGTPMLNDEAVLKEAADDEAWHREEDRRMRREYGEEI